MKQNNSDEREVSQYLRVIQLVLKINFCHLEEGSAGEERVRASLVLGSDPFNLQHIRHLLEAALQVLATLHQIFDVVNVGEVDLQSLEKLSLAFGQVAVGQHGQEISRQSVRDEN